MPSARENRSSSSTARACRVLPLLLAALAFPAILAPQVLAQGFSWPWDDPAPRRPAEQPPPAWQPPPEPAPPPVQQPYGTFAGKSPICLQLEQRLVQEGQKGNQSRDLLPLIEGQLREASQQLSAAKQQIERANCYDYFLFSKTLRRTRKCVDLSDSVDQLKRQVADLETQRNQISIEAGRSYQDDIIRELARNNCGASYAREASRRDSVSNPFSSLWQEDGGGSGGYGSTYSAVPYATYRTLCVRLCDGYYFPISFSTLPNHFERDAEVCQSKCAAPAELYYYQNPGGAVDQMVGVQSNTPYTQLPSAFRYRKEYVNGCSCKMAEYAPDGVPGGQPQQEQQGSLGSGSTGGAQSARAQPPPASDASAWSSETLPTP